MKQKNYLTPEKFAETYTDEKFRNDVAFAHGCVYEGEEEYRETCTYPVRYVVTDEQIKEAETERQRAIQQTIKENEGKLMFVGMGCTYPARYEDDVCNHRIRTEFVNAEGHKHFIELGTMGAEKMRIDHAVDRDLEDIHKDKINELWEQRNKVDRYSKEWNAISKEMDIWQRQSYYNYKGLERKDNLPKYTKQNVLKLVNKYFGCNFKEIVIDNYNVSCDQFFSVSPQFKTITAQSF